MQYSALSSQSGTSALSTSVTHPKLGETKALERLQEALGWGKDSGSQTILTMLNQFTVRGPNGDHHCLVFELLGPSIATSMQNASIINDEFPAEFSHTTRSFHFLVQLLRTVSFIHTVRISQGGT